MTLLRYNFIHCIHFFLFRISSGAQSLLEKMLKEDPRERIDLESILRDPFFSNREDYPSSDSGFNTYSQISSQTNLTNQTNRIIKQPMLQPISENHYRTHSNYHLQEPNYRQPVKPQVNSKILASSSHGYHPQMRSNEPSMISLMPPASPMQNSRICTKTPPFNTLRLRPTRSEIKGIEFEILKDGKLLLRNKIPANRSGVHVQEMIFQSDGLKFEASTNYGLEKYEYETMPQEFRRYYNMAYKFIEKVGKYLCVK